MGIGALAGHSTRDTRMSREATLRALWLEGAERERQRIREIQTRWAWYHGQVQVPAEPGETKDHYARRAKLMINLMKRTVKIKRSMLYGTGIKADIEPAKARKALEAIHELNDIHRFRLRLATAGMVAGTGIVQPVWAQWEDGPGIKYRLHGAENVIAIMDPMDPETIKELRVVSDWFDPDGDKMHVKMEAVTAATWRVFVDDEHRPDLEVDGGKNPYGFLPFVFFRNTEDSELPWGGDEIADLINMQGEFNCRASDASNVVKHHGSPALVTKNVRGQIVLGPDRHIELQGSDADVSYLTWNQDMPGAIALMDRMVDWMATVSETPAPELMNLEGLGNLTSGRAIRLLYAMTIRSTLERQLLYGAAEKELAWASLRVLGTHTGSSFDRPEMTLHWPSDLVPVDELTRLKGFRAKRELKLETQADQLRQLHPDWTDDRIAEYQTAIAAERTAMIRGAGESLTPRENAEIERVMAEAEKAAVGE